MTPSSSSSSRPPYDYGRLKELLDTQETFPLQYTFKIIGANTPEFTQGIDAFQNMFPKLSLQTRRESAEGGHISLTFSLTADSSTEIIWLYEQASTIPDVKALL